MVKIMREREKSKHIFGPRRMELSSTRMKKNYEPIRGIINMLDPRYRSY
jgi:hypothetical protein